jgi:hypothetical protein
MSTLKKIAVLSMLVVMIIAFNIPASLADSVGTVGAGAGAKAVANAGLSKGGIGAGPIGGGLGIGAPAGFGAFGGFGFPFNWGFAPYGVGCFPFNWGIGGGFSPFGLLSWNHFSPGFGSFPLSPGFLGCCQGLPFILGSQLGCNPVLGWDMSSWAFGLQSCTRSLPLYFGAHGFGFPFTIGNYRIGMTPCLQGLPFILGSQLGCNPVLGWDMSSWAFGLQSCTRSLPLYFGAHGFGFPFTIGNYRIGMTPCL